MEKRYWNEYQKEIADDHYFYERSCIRQTFFPGSEAAFLRMMREVLHKDIYDEENAHTCTGIGYHSDFVPLETTMTVVARLFALMTAKGYTNYVPSCVTSFGIFSEMVEMWEHHPELLEKTRKYLREATGREFEIPKNIKAGEYDVKVFESGNLLKSDLKCKIKKKMAQERNLL